MEVQPQIQMLADKVDALDDDKSQRDLYVSTFSQLEALKGANSTLSLMKTMRPDEFKMAETKIRQADEEASLSALVKNGEIVIFNSKVADLVFPVQLLICVGFVTLAWLLTTLLTKPAATSTLRSFYQLCHPGGPGWKKVVLDARAEGIEIDQKDGITDWKLPVQLLCVFIGCVAIYSSLFAVGNFVYSNMLAGSIMSVLAAASMYVLFKLFGKLGAE